MLSSSIAFLLELSRGTIERSIVVDIERHIGDGAAAGLVKIDLAAAHPTLVDVVVSHRRLARPEYDRKAANPARGRIPAFDLFGAACQSGPASGAPPP